MYECTATSGVLYIAEQRYSVNTGQVYLARSQANVVPNTMARMKLSVHCPFGMPIKRSGEPLGAGYTPYRLLVRARGERGNQAL